VRYKLDLMGQQLLKAGIVPYPPDNKRRLIIEQQSVAHLQPFDVAVSHTDLNGLASRQNEPQISSLIHRVLVRIPSLLAKRVSSRKPVPQQR